MKVFHPPELGWTGRKCQSHGPQPCPYSPEKYEWIRKILYQQLNSCKQVLSNANEFSFKKIRRFIKALLKVAQQNSIFLCHLQCEIYDQQTV